MESTERFSNRVADYVRYRPGYPDAIVETLREKAGLEADAVVADIGSGTGISSELFLRNGLRVYAVEPNDAMRDAAEEWLSGRDGFQSVNGTADATGLPDRSVDLVAAGQAFHWFDREGARREFQRILRDPRGPVALFWNSRRTDDTPFLREYEALLHEFATDYANVNHRNIDHASLAAFFGRDFERVVIPTEQHFDFAGLAGRLLSSSYAPAPGHPRHDPMLARLRAIFDARSVDGRVSFLYDTELFFAPLA